MNEIRSLRSVLVWIVPFAIVLAILGWETDWGDGVSLPVPVAVPTKPQPVDVALMPEYRIEGGAAARKETVDRVLFNPTRRPAPPAEQAAGGPSAIPHGAYTLTGTTIAGGVATAMLRDAKTGKSRIVRQGEKLDGVLVAEVKPDHVRLVLGKEFEDLQLKIAPGPARTAQAAPQALAGRAGTVPQLLPPQAVPVPPSPNAAVAPVQSVAELLAARRRAAQAAAAAPAGGSKAAGAALDPRWAEDAAAIRARVEGQRAPQ